ncbi:putative RNA methylase [Gloeothece citriformis PCC 7424]|uniref:Putative RNA methylase n=1 Tax=Gloeothece citriformis (strain PCC 7424) TaxID=65393 RepID=B7KLB2_GLOC7|nr:methyltransferase domain-containing protein [Gloeothece citriformis]ACK72484.1 putative RNA methylase [Gloeothece citriformis PCC 7424]
MVRRLTPLWLCLATGISFLSLNLAGCSQPDLVETETPEPGATVQSQIIRRDVPYVPTSEAVVQEMLRIAQVSENDILYDLGSGDGRIPIKAAQLYGARGVGVEIDPKLVQEATENAKKAGVSDRVQFIEQDLFQTDISEATVVTLYLLSTVNLRLRPKLLTELKPGTRIVSHAFNMGDWKPEKVVEVNGNSKIYYWVVPETIPDHLLQEQG